MNDNTTQTESRKLIIGDRNGISGDRNNHFSSDGDVIMIEKSPIDNQKIESTSGWGLYVEREPTEKSSGFSPMGTDLSIKSSVKPLTKCSSVKSEIIESCENLTKNCDKNPENIKSGIQGSVFLNCSDGNVKKISTVSGLNIHNNPEDLQFYSNMCKHHKMISGTNHPNIVKTPDCKHCFDKTNISDSSVVLTQEKVNGHDLYTYLSINSQSDKGGIKDVWSLEILERNIWGIILQIIGVIDFLYQNKLYHNDVHVRNVMLVKNRNSISYKTATEPSVEYTIESNYVVKLIDYGMSTYNYQLDKKYHAIENTDYPYLDILHFLTSLYVTIESRKTTDDEKNKKREIILIITKAMSVLGGAINGSRESCYVKDNVSKGDISKIISIFLQKYSESKKMIGGIYHKYLINKTNYLKIK